MSESTVPVLRLANRQPIQVARLKATDHDAVVAMLGRCSATTLQHRFHAVSDGVPYVTRLLTNVTAEIGFGAWLAGRCVGLASLHAVNQTSAEMAVLVEDEWQQCGVGSALVLTLARHAREQGWRRLRADVQGDNHFIPAALTRMGRTRTSISFGIYTIWVELEEVA
jgi:GNAT superfamily N-acetyltransferase